MTIWITIWAAGEHLFIEYCLSGNKESSVRVHEQIFLHIIKNAQVHQLQFEW